MNLLNLSTVKSVMNMVLVFSSMLAISAYAETHTVGQKDKAFTMAELKVGVGDTVAFRNDDPFFHNVFSLSDAKLFDLGSYPQGESREIVFDEPGVVEVECAVHPEMVMTITVE